MALILLGALPKVVETWKEMLGLQRSAWANSGALPARLFTLRFYVQLAGLRRMVETRKEMLLQRSLWENRMQAHIDAIQRAEHEKDLQAKMVISNFHSGRARI
jgi:hypothetical protein